MAKQNGFFKLSGGSIGDITYYKTKNGYHVRGRRKKKEEVAEDKACPFGR